MDRGLNNLSIYCITRAVVWENLHETCRAQMDPEKLTFTLCELVQSKWTWTCAIDMHMNTSEEPSYARIYRRNAVPRRIPRPRPSLCASLRSRGAHGHVARTILCENLQVKCRRPNSTLCELARHAHEPVLCENFQEKNPETKWSPLIIHRPQLLP